MGKGIIDPWRQEKTPRAPKVDPATIIENSRIVTFKGHNRGINVYGAGDSEHAKNRLLLALEKTAPYTQAYREKWGIAFDPPEYSPTTDLVLENDKIRVVVQMTEGYARAINQLTMFFRDLVRDAKCRPYMESYRIKPYVT